MGKKEERGRKSEGPKQRAFCSKHLPERLAVHVFLCDATVGERLVPHGVQRVANSLGFQFIGLCIAAERRGKQEYNSKPFPRAANIKQPQSSFLLATKSELRAHIFIMQL